MHHDKMGRTYKISGCIGRRPDISKCGRFPPSNHNREGAARQRHLLYFSRRECSTLINSCWEVSTRRTRRLVDFVIEANVSPPLEYYQLYLHFQLSLICRSTISAHNSYMITV
jgi:hypothetical protein